MARSEKLQQLDRRIADSVLGALSDLRDEIRQRLREHTDSIEDRLQALGGVLPESFLTDADVEPWAAQASQSARQSAHADLQEAVAAMDRARSQAAILGTFLESCGGYASRAAVFLTRADGVRGWGGFGFASDAVEVSGLRFDYGEGSPWAQLASEAATIELATADSARICSQLESEVPSAAVLIPIVLNDRLAGAVYADQVGDDRQLEVAPIQLLAYVAAQAIETLPFRQRSQTATLVSAGGAGSGALPLWDQDDATARPAVEDSASEAASPLTASTPAENTATQSLELGGGLLEKAAEAESAVAEEAEEAEEGDADAVSTAAEVEEPDRSSPYSWRYDGAEQAAEEDAEAEEVEAAVDEERDEGEETTAGEEFGGSQEEIEVEAISQVEEEVRLEPSGPDEELEIATPDAMSALEGGAVATPEISPGFATAEFEIPAPSVEPKLAAEEPVETISTAGLGFDISSAFDEPVAVAVEEPTPEVEEPAPAASASTAAPPAMPDIDVSEDETVLLPRSPAGAAPAAPAAASPASPAPGERNEDTQSGVAGLRGGTPLVQPPTDIEGPGSAFRTAAPGSAASALSQEDEAAHEEARRLARLLISEIRLYYEDQVHEGRRNRDIYRRLREDIDRSRKMYEERVDESVRGARDFFHEELVRILADGDEGALGL